MKNWYSIFVLLMIVSCSKPHTDKTNYINPIGTYVQKPKAEGGTDGGDIQVQAIEKDKIIVNLYVNRGAPSYNSGSAFDTLTYNNNKALYKAPEYDPSCKIMLEFSEKGIKVKEETDDYNSGCGFGHAVIADGFFEKTSSKEPVFINYSTGEKME